MNTSAIIRMLVHKKWLIIGSVLVAMVTTFILTNYYSTKVFEGRLEVRFDEFLFKSNITNLYSSKDRVDEKEPLNRMLSVILNKIEYPSVTKKSITNILRSNSVKKFSSEIAKGTCTYTVEPDKDNNLIYITLRGTDLTIMKKLEEAIKNKAGEIIQKNLNSGFGDVKKYLIKEMEKEKSNMETFQKTLDQNVKGLEYIEANQNLMLSKEAFEACITIKKELDVPFQNRWNKDDNLSISSEVSYILAEPKLKRNLALSFILSFLGSLSLLILLDLKNSFSSPE